MASYIGYKSPDSESRVSELILNPEFPSDVLGADEWREIVSWLVRVDDDTTPEEIDRQLNLLRRLPNQPGPCPRVFVSHKSVDKDLALRIAELAADAGFDYWVDVLDPNLIKLVPAPNSVQKAVAVALIVEMALLNCTHVLAVMTSNTHTSTWVPYEYGRVKDRNRISVQAAAWLEPKHFAVNVFPEYLYLGERHTLETEISRWYLHELSKTKHKSLCGPKYWPYAATVQLPTP